jgi:GxxExxY protein
MPLHIASPLSPEIELIVERIIGCAIEVHKALGSGLLEGIYEDALSIEFEHVGLSYDRQRQIPLNYRGKPLRSHRLDLVVENVVLVEIKAVDRLHPVHGSQVLSYLRSSGLRVCLLMNFNAYWLKAGLRRYVL